LASALLSLLPVRHTNCAVHEIETPVMVLNNTVVNGTVVNGTVDVEDSTPTPIIQIVVAVAGLIFGFFASLMTFCNPSPLFIVFVAVLSITLTLDMDLGNSTQLINIRAII